jgi:alanine racemase
MSTPSQTTRQAPDLAAMRTTHVSSVRDVQLRAGLRPNALVVDLAAIAGNVHALRQAVGQSVRIVAALKADAHGHGLLPVARAATEAGADGVALVNISEALTLRDTLEPRCELLAYVGAYMDKELVSLCERQRIILTVVNSDSGRQYSRWASKSLEVYVKVDVGLERLGVHAERAPEFVRWIEQLPRLRVGGLYTHMHVSGTSEPVSDYLRWQFDRFCRAIAEIDAQGSEVPVRMAAASPVLLRSLDMNLNAVDPGRLVYGVRPTGPPVVPLQLTPAARALTSRLVQVKDVPQRDFLDDAQTALEPGMRIGIMPIGQVDGMPQISSGHVLVRGVRVPLLGGPHLEYTRVNLSAVPDASPGDEVVLVGRHDGETITVADVATYHGATFDDGIAVLVADSVQRVYV